MVGQRLCLIIGLWLVLLCHPSWAGTFAQGVKALQAGQYPVAIANFEQAIQTYDHAAAALQNRCLASLLAETYPAAIEACTAALPASDAYLHRGVSYLRNAQPTLALADFQAALAQAPADHRLYYNRGLALSALSQPYEALAAFDQALNFAQDPVDQAEIWIDRGLTLNQLPRTDRTEGKAITNLSTALVLDSSNSRAFYNRGCLYLAQHQPQAAEADFDQAVALNAADADTYRDRALSRYAQGNHQGAQRDLLLAARYSLSQQDYRAYHEIAVLLLALPLEVVV